MTPENEDDIINIRSALYTTQECVYIKTYHIIAFMKGKAMKAIMIPEPGKVEISEIEKPVLKAGEAILKPLYGGLCGTDLNSYRGTAAYTVYPCLPGHEFSAEIVEIAENDKGFKPGMKVICNPYFNCGECYSCRHGLVNACMDNKTMGVQRSGAFSEYVSVPVERLFNGEGISAKTLAIVEPFVISYHIIRRANVQPGDTVLIVGAGTIGVYSALAAMALGGEVTICDIAEEKLDYAQKMYDIPHTILNSSPEAFMEGVKELTGGNGFDVTVDAAGFPSTFKNCVDALAYGGRLSLSGYSKDLLNGFDYSVIQKHELSILGSRNGVKQDFEDALALVRAGKVDLDKAVTNVYSWLDAPKAFADFSANAGRMLKVMLNFTEG